MKRLLIISLLISLVLLVLLKTKNSALKANITRTHTAAASTVESNVFNHNHDKPRESSIDQIAEYKSKWLELSDDELKIIQIESEEELNSRDIIEKINSGIISKDEMAVGQDLLAKKTAAQILLIKKSLANIESEILKEDL